MNYCLWCHEEIIDETNWFSFINGKEQNNLCHNCQNEFKFISGLTCRKCRKRSTNKICNDCLSWRHFFSEKDPLEQNVSTFYYNGFLKDVIARWKYRGDYILIDMFTTHIKKTIRKCMKHILSDAILVPIPLSKERLTERGFNQSLAIAERISELQIQIQPILERVHGEKQSKKTRAQRIFGKNPFNLLKKTNKTVILVDDIYTTGTTIRHAATLLKQSGCPKVYSYSLIRG